MSEIMTEPHKLSDDKWGGTTGSYIKVVEPMTIQLAEDVVSIVNEKSPLSRTGLSTFDNGCGSGTVTKVLRTKFPDLPILAADFSPRMIKAVEDLRLPNVRTQVLDATNLADLKEDTFTHTFSTIMVQFTPDPYKALTEMYRVTKPGGHIGLGMWAEMCFEFAWVDACKHFEPDYTFERVWTDDWYNKDQIKAYVEKAGFKDVYVKTIRRPWNWKTPESCSQFFLESNNPCFAKAIQSWKDRGMYDQVYPLHEKILREKYNGGKDYEAIWWVYVGRK